MKSDILKFTSIYDKLTTIKLSDTQLWVNKSSIFCVFNSIALEQGMDSISDNVVSVINAS